MNGVVNRVEARQSEDGSILSTCYDFGLATAQFRFDTPQLAAGSFIKTAYLKCYPKNAF
jgi:hypothetical protein